MGNALLLDRVIGATYPSFATAADVAAFERVPIEDRLAVHSTYAALKVGAARDPNAPALQFLATASPDDTPVVVTHGQFFARVTQVANALHTLGVGPTDVVSFLLPLIPQALNLAGHGDTGVAIRAAELYYNLVALHPFSDGNGRTARLIMNFFAAPRRVSTHGDRGRATGRVLDCARPSERRRVVGVRLLCPGGNRAVDISGARSANLRWMIAARACAIRARIGENSAMVS